MQAAPLEELELLDEELDAELDEDELEELLLDELDDELPEPLLDPLPPQAARNAAVPPEASQVSIWRRCRMRSMLIRSRCRSGLWSSCCTAESFGTMMLPIANSQMAQKLMAGGECAQNAARDRHLYIGFTIDVKAV